MEYKHTVVVDLSHIPILIFDPFFFLLGCVGTFAKISRTLQNSS
jgi:hypothetical protein